ncbi:hypothetical protein RRG08_032911 [Elysia crispata]|uniref:Uncharacterized protein n=1 Tax=Elysia crispata TaxID=231223 RepID=A0AAE1DTA9_9GAST|nr:hypothetical protein RRG08_032911 [Elysia crispata]
MSNLLLAGLVSHKPTCLCRRLLSKFCCPQGGPRALQTGIIFLAKEEMASVRLALQTGIIFLAKEEMASVRLPVCSSGFAQLPLLLATKKPKSATVECTSGSIDSEF